MSNIFRKRYTVPLPADAELVTVKGVPSARFKCKGRMITAPRTKDGDRVRLQTASYYGRIDGKPVKLFKDAVASQQRLAELLRKAERQESGVADPFEEHRVRPILDHVDDYRRFLEAEGNCAEYVTQTIARISAIVAGCTFNRIADLASEKVAEFLHGLRRDPPRLVLPTGKAEFTSTELTEALGGNRPVKLTSVIMRERLAPGTGNGKRRRYPRTTVEALQDIYCRGISIATSNGYLAAIKGFSKWLMQKERIDRDRLVSLSRLNAQTDLRHERRALGEIELNLLLEAAWNSTSIFEGLTGPDRAMIYLLAMSSGLRASELASLTPSRFALDGCHPAVTVRAGYTKNRHEAEQPLPADIAAEFRKYLQGRLVTAPLWPGKWNELAAEMLRGDLEAAGIVYRDADGAVADFHAIRHSYISLLGSMGNSPKVTQTLARHSDIRLTMNVYSHAQLHDLTAAVEGLPVGLPKSPSHEALRATGTDGKASEPIGEPSFLPFSCRADEDTRGIMRNSEEMTTTGDGAMARLQTVVVNGVEDQCGSVSGIEENLPRMDSNHHKESQNLLCYRYTTG